MTAVFRSAISLVFLALSACMMDSPHAEELDRDAAIEIAQQEVSFEPQSIEAERLVVDDRKVWRITFRGTPGPPPLVPIMIVTIDRITGQVISLARS
jgi:hypothetical protein